MRFAYYDPPYPGKARLYRNEPSFAGEVDHHQLVQNALAGGFDGWALSTSGRLGALRMLLPLLPDTAIVAPWVKPGGGRPDAYGPHNRWEALLVVPGRRLRTAPADFLYAQPARGGGTLVGRKPIAFVAWLFGMLGARAGDTLVDVFPGTGIVGRAWEELSGSSSKYSDDFRVYASGHAR